MCTRRRSVVLNLAALFPAKVCHSPSKSKLRVVDSMHIFSFFFVFLSVLYCTFIFFSVFLCALLFFLCYYRCFFGSLKRAPFCLVFCYAVFYLYFILHFPFFLSIRTQSNQSYRLKTGINVCSLHLRYNIY